MHHKLMVIDDRVRIGGSFNYTGPANQLNDENIFMLGNINAATQDSIKAQKALARYARTEIERIIEVFGEKIN